MVRPLPGLAMLIPLLVASGVLYTTVHKGWATFLAIVAMFVLTLMLPSRNG